MRPTLDEYFMGFAKQASTRATCNRAMVGAVIVDGKFLLSSGYNGSDDGEPHCLDAGCLMVDGHCVRTIHSERNAIRQCLKRNLNPAGTTIYCTHLPCLDCAKYIVDNGIVRVVYSIPYRNSGESIAYLESSGIEVKHHV